MNNELLTLGIAAVYVVIFGFFTARTSNKHDPVYGGQAVQTLHILGCGLFVAILPTVLTSAFILHTGHMIPSVVVGAAVASYAVLLVFAALERPHREQALADKERRGWTEQDARTSGL